MIPRCKADPSLRDVQDIWRGFFIIIIMARERILQKTEPETLSSLGREFNTAAMKAPLLLREAAERFLWKFLDVTDLLPSVWQLF